MHCINIAWTEGKTERECVKVAVRMAKEKGYQDIRDLIKNQTPVKAGDKIYAVCMDKSVSLFQIGKKPLGRRYAIFWEHTSIHHVLM